MIAFVAAAFSAAFLFSISIGLELIPWRRATTAHWTERARLLVPARVAMQLSGWLIPCVLVIITRIFWPMVHVAPVFVGAVAGVALGSYPSDREIIPGLSLRSWFHLLGAGLVMKFLRWVTFLAAAWFMPGNFGWATWLIAAAFLLFQLGFTLGLGLRLLQGMRLLRPASSRLARLVEETSVAAGVPVRATWELVTPSANAFAFITTRELVFTTGLVEAMPDDELRAVCRHELAHIAESRWAVVGRIIGSLALVPLIFFRPAYAQLGGAGVAITGLVAGLVWWLRFPLSRALEQRADRAAVQVVNDGLVYARALERIHQLNQFPAVLRKSSLKTHPDLYDRMLAAGLTPDYPRPAVPSSHTWSSTVLTVICTLYAMYEFLRLKGH